MDKFTKRAGLMLAAGVAALAALPAPGFAQEGLRIGVSMHSQVQRRWGFDVATMQAEADRLGVELLVQWANEDPTVQASQVENLLSQGIDALIIVPADSQAAGRIVDSAQGSGVPVVAYDIGITTAVPDFSVIRNNVQAGRIQAEAALAFAPEGNWAILKGDAGSDVAQLFAQGYTEVLDGNTSINIVFDQFIQDWDTQRALDNAENILSANDDDIRAFLVTNDSMAIGVSRALTARGLGGEVFLSGLDADPGNLQLVRDGIQTLSIWTDLRAQGAAAVQAAVALAGDGLPDIPYEEIDAGAGPVPTHLVETMAITADNLCQFITEIAPEGWVTVAEVFEDPDACAG